ncbi:MAG: hypothetical protein ACFCVE_09485 [Phycisphaerae bacterium]
MGGTHRQTGGGNAGGGLGGWLGRQVGYVRRAVKTNVAVRTLYRRQEVHERPMPGRPTVTLRRTTIDEAVEHPPTPTEVEGRGPT